MSENKHNSENSSESLHTHSHILDDGDGHSRMHSHSHEHTKTVLNRMSRAIGHMTAVRKMVEDGRDCSDVLIQLSAVRSAINGICEVILKDHIDHCIVTAAKSGDMATIEELNRAIKLLMK